MSVEIDGNSFDNIFEEDRSMEAKAKVTSYRDLIVWQRAMQLVEGVYHVSKNLPENEKVALAGQINAAAVVVPAKIAEGWGRKNTKNYLQLLKTARASLFITETYLIMLQTVGLIEESEEQRLLGYVDEVKKMLNGLIKSLNNKLKTNTNNF